MLRILKLYSPSPPLTTYQPPFPPGGLGPSISMFLFFIYNEEIILFGSLPHFGDFLQSKTNVNFRQHTIVPPSHQMLHNN